MQQMGRHSRSIKYTPENELQTQWLSCKTAHSCSFLAAQQFSGLMHQTHQEPQLTLSMFASCVSYNSAIAIWCLAAMLNRPWAIKYQQDCRRPWPQDQKRYQWQAWSKTYHTQCTGRQSLWMQYASTLTLLAATCTGGLLQTSSEATKDKMNKRPHTFFQLPSKTMVISQWSTHCLLCHTQVHQMRTVSCYTSVVVEVCSLPQSTKVHACIRAHHVSENVNGTCQAADSLCRVSTSSKHTT